MDTWGCGSSCGGGAQVEFPAKSGEEGCFWCGAPDHFANACSYARSTCRRCGKVGHIEQKCFQ
ncbi:MAG: hypothetical protein GY782_06325, partial [Gammaproteobacteria bacterium]|nr:hypothetical protein [Gammaproteobacteria bacterium]